MLGTVHSTTSAVQETVASVKDAVQGTVESVKGTVQETVETVKENLSLRTQVDRHPWMMLGGAVALGYLGGCLLERPRAGRSWAPYSRYSSASHGNGRAPAAAPASTAFSAPAPAAETPAAPSGARSEGILSHFGHMLEPELRRLKGLAIGTLLGAARDALERSVPEPLGPQLAGVVNDITTKLGGEPLRGPVLRPDRSTTVPT